MTDPEVHTLTGPYVLNALPDLERDHFERHLAACEFCRAEVAELREASTKLALHVATPPPLDLKSRVMAAIDQTRQLPPVSPGEGIAGKRRSFSRRTAFSLAAAALAVAASGGIAFDQYRARTQAEGQASTATTEAARASAQADRIAALLAQADARTVRAPVTGGGQVTLVTSHRSSAAAVILHNLHDLPADRTWQLWFIDKSGTAHSIGITATDLTQLTTADLSTVTAFGLTVEPTGGSKHPTLPAAAEIPLV